MLDEECSLWCSICDIVAAKAVGAPLPPRSAAPAAPAPSSAVPVPGAEEKKASSSKKVSPLMVKSQWNACYAIGRILASPALAAVLEKSVSVTGKQLASICQCLRKMFESLLQVVRGSNNLKARLSTPPCISFLIALSCVLF